jgi:hypothetical protein
MLMRRTPRQEAVTRNSPLRGGCLALAATTIAVTTLTIAFSAHAGREHDYVGFEKCRTCHEKELMGNQVATWQAGPHARAYETLLGEESLAIAQKLGLREAPVASDACLSCHVTAHGVPPTRIANLLALADGVQCESCHGPGRDYRKKKIMADPKKAAKKGLLDAGGDATICIACHNEESPTFDATRYQLTDSTTAGFDFEIAKTRIPHEIPEHVRGRFIELEKAEKEAAKQGQGQGG